jgi:DNA repair protein RadD
MTYQLRPHQTTAIQLLRESFGKGNKTPLLQAPTGFGKTLIAVDIIKSALAKGKRVLFVVDRITLIDQTSEAMDKHGIEHGVIQGDHWRVNNQPFQIASLQTFMKRRNKPNFDLIIVDEAHGLYKSFVDFMTKTWNNLPYIGLSATPFTKGLGNIYDDLIVVESTQSLIDNGYLCDFTAYGAPIDMTGVRTTAGDYNGKDLEVKVNKKKIVGDVVKTWLRLGENRQSVCFAVSVAHSEAIVDEFLANGVAAAHIDAHTSSEERERILTAHADGHIKILSNVGITTKGWDSPDTTCLIYARPTKSLMLHIQILGRILRVSSCGSDALILDHGGNIARLGFPTDQLPEFLCNGNKDETESKKADAAEKKEKLPTPCEKCTHLSTEFICPKCGHKPAMIPNVEMVDAKLEKLKKVPATEKARWLGELLGYARSKGMNDGWASHKFNEKFGHFPARKVGIPAVAPSPEVLGYIKHLNIKWAKSKSR